MRFFSDAFHALAIDDRCTRAYLAFRLLPAPCVKRMVQPGQGAIMLPATEVKIDLAAVVAGATLVSSHRKLLQIGQVR